MSLIQSSQVRGGHVSWTWREAAMPEAADVHRLAGWYRVRVPFDRPDRRFERVARLADYTTASMRDER
jgi:hypothetical protein